MIESTSPVRQIDAAALWKSAIEGAKLRDASFTTLSSYPVQPLYGPEDADVDFERDLEVGRVVGRGSFGMINRGLFRGFPCAIKSLLPESFISTTLRGRALHKAAVTSFCEEMVLCSKLRHPNIIQFFGCSMRPSRLSRRYVQSRECIESREL